MNKTIAQRFMELFSSNPNMYGVTTLAGTRETDGKQEARCRLEKKPLTEEVWAAHLAGTNAIGCVPIHPNNAVRWGAIDIDIYGEAFSIEDLQQKITKDSLPFVVCRSKSGGAHVYLFVKKAISAQLMMDKLNEFAAYFGQGKSEIFPKQAKISEKREDDHKYGSWLNMPFDGEDTLRYAYGADGSPILDQEDFLEYAESHALEPARLKELEVPLISDAAPLPGGPPCLNYIFTERAELGEMRNQTLTQVMVYLKKADPDNAEKRLSIYNSMFGDPMKPNEVAAIFKSASKKDYKYACPKDPICRYCNAKLCKQQLHGIGSNDFLPNNRSLVQLMTTPTIWYLTLEGVEIQLSSEEFDNFTLFNRRVMEMTRKKYPPMKPDDWADMQNLLLANATCVWIPKEMTPQGQLIELLSEYRTTASRSSDDLFKGQAWATDAGDLIFSMTPFKQFLELHKFRDLKSNEILGVIKNELKATKEDLRKGNSLKRCWRVSADQLNTHIDPDAIKSPDESPY
jgi:hypothetical protein